MAVTITKDKYPAFGGETGVSGKRFKLYVNYGTGATADGPVWVPVGGCENLTFTPTVDVQTKQTKDGGMWAGGGVSGKSFTVSADILCNTEDVGQKVIEKFIYDDDITTEKKALQFARVNLDTAEYRVFTAVPTGFEETSEAEDMVQYAFQATGIGKPEDKADWKEPETATVTGEG